ncbi:pyridoxal phosphate-dependent aminotransferase [Eubacterium aggregans]|uniref:pyridoxal phosphate-dependent aminotransferase n=1 Tax=Eubacterium aggregans TaxID=81409 RepID=UPI003F2BDEA8
MNVHGGYHGVNAKMLDFSVNINPLGMPPRLKYDLIAAMDDLGRYPEIAGASQRDRLAGHLGVYPGQVILGNGAIELIYLFARSLCRSDSKALIVSPTFNEYRRALTMNGWEGVTEWVAGADVDFRIDPGALARAIAEEQPNAVFICNPNNPTGMAYSCDYLRDLMDECDPGILWFIDESFIDFSTKESSLTLVADEGRPVILLRSMTKFFGIPGLRIGYAVGHEAIIHAMERYKEPWSINSLALEAVDTVFRDTHYMETTKNYIRKERHLVYVALSKLNNLKVYQSAADFHLCRLKCGTAPAINEGLNTRNINIRTCEDFTGLGSDYFRIAVKKAEDNDALMTALTEIVG